MSDDNAVRSDLCKLKSEQILVQRLLERLARIVGACGIRQLDVDKDRLCVDWRQHVLEAASCRFGESAATGAVASGEEFVVAREVP